MILAGLGLRPFSLGSHPHSALVPSWNTRRGPGLLRCSGRETGNRLGIPSRTHCPLRGTDAKVTPRATGKRDIGVGALRQRGDSCPVSLLLPPVVGAGSGDGFWRRRSLSKPESVG